MLRSYQKGVLLSTCGRPSSTVGAAPLSRRFSLLQFNVEFLNKILCGTLIIFFFYFVQSENSTILTCMIYQRRGGDWIVLWSWKSAYALVIPANCYRVVSQKLCLTDINSHLIICEKNWSIFICKQYLLVISRILSNLACWTMG